MTFITVHQAVEAYTAARAVVVTVRVHVDLALDLGALVTAFLALRRTYVR